MYHCFPWDISSSLLWTLANAHSGCNLLGCFPAERRNIQLLIIAVGLQHRFTKTFVMTQGTFNLGRVEKTN